MTLGTHDAVRPPEAEVGRTRDAARTRQLLLEAARRRFAYDGYSATTSRDIAGDVGVNVALINRYFGSKEALFEACLTRTAEEIDEPRLAPEAIVRTMIEQITRPTRADRPLVMLMLLRSSGDERADEIRRRMLQQYTERIAAVSGWRADDASTAHLLLQAQVAMAMGFGIVVMRTSSELEPLTSATAEQLGEPLRRALEGLLPIPEAGTA